MNIVKSVFVFLHGVLFLSVVSEFGERGWAELFVCVCILYCVYGMLYVVFLHVCIK